MGATGGGEAELPGAPADREPEAGAGAAEGTGAQTKKCTRIESFWIRVGIP